MRRRGEEPESPGWYVARRGKFRGAGALLTRRRGGRGAARRVRRVRRHRRTRYPNAEERDVSKLIRALIAGWGAKKLGGGCLSTIVVFIILFWLLGYLF